MPRRNLFIPVAIGRKQLTNHLKLTFDPVDCQIFMQADFISLFGLLSEHRKEDISVVWDMIILNSKFYSTWEVNTEGLEFKESLGYVGVLCTD